MLEHCDVLVVGGGAAAIRAAIEAARSGAEVTMVCSGEFAHSGTSPLALHGLTSVLGADDSEATLLKDILDSGDRLNDVDLVEVAVAAARTEPALLEAMGVRFMHHADGTYDIYRGAGHSVGHGLTFDEHGHHDTFVHVLAPAAWVAGVKLVQHVMVAELLVEDGRVVGAVGREEHGAERIFAAKAVVLAAGGANHAYPNTVPRIADDTWRTTGDGYALALRAGLSLVDMEMANFRDTPPLARFNGRYLNAKGERFMERYDPMLENAPRDTVVAAIYSEMQAGNGPIYIDLPEEAGEIVSLLPEEFQNAWKAFKEGRRPTATITFQRLLGGARILPDASTAIAGLYVAGENAGGFHGGDRLQGAAFLETQVFGRLAGTSAARYAGTHAVESEHVERLAADALPRVRAFTHAYGPPAHDLIAEIRQLNWDHVGIVKDAAGLQKALARITEIRETIAGGLHGAYVFEPLEAANLALVAEAMARASLAREESRGAHRRSDFPEHRAEFARKHTSVTRTPDGTLAVAFVPCRDGTAATAPVLAR